MKRTITIYIAVLLALVLCACGTPNSAAPSESSGSSDSADIDNSKTAIGVMTQEYNGDNIAEILMISYDGNNPEIEAINSAIKNGIQQMYLDFMENQSEDSFEWIEIKSYPFTSDDYLQIVTSHIIYPTYGTNGDIESYNFNKKENRYITIEDAMSDTGLTRETITQNVKELYAPEFPSMSVGEVEPAGFLIRQGQAGPYTLFLLEIVVDNSEAEPWKGLFAYVPQSDELYELGENCLFDPYDMDEMDPPLSYGKGEAE